MTRRKILRRDVHTELAASLPATLHPVLRRVYAARTLNGPQDLELGLERERASSSNTAARCW
jgi:hypothetical protein